MIAIWLFGLLRRRAWRLAGTASGIAAAVALVGCLGVFLAASQATMTARATARVAVDWQVEVAPGADPATVAAAVAADPGTRAALPVGFAHLPGLSTDAGGTRRTTGAAVVLGIPDGYRARFAGQIRTLAGAGDGVLIAQQTAANLHATPGSVVAVQRPGQPSARFTVAGIVDLPQANSLFQTVGAPPGAQPAAPPDNVLLLPAAAFADLTGPAQLPVTTQIHAVRTHLLPAAPAAAYTTETAGAHHLEAGLAGGGRVGDNLAATLDAARQDAAYATALFLFLGLPGAVLAAAVTAIVAGTGAARRRREQALARTRGATTASLLRLAVAEAALVGVTGGIAGLLIAAAVGRWWFGSASFGADTATASVWAAGAFLAGLAVAVVSVAWPTWRDLRSSVRNDRTPHRVHPLWIIGCAIAGTLVWLRTRNTGYALVLAPEGVATISVDYWAFLAPALLWVAAGLTAYRATVGILTRGRRALARLLRPLTGRLAPTVAATMSRQQQVIAQAVTVLALALAFAATTATFNATYRAQAAVDARLTNGADVTVTTAGAADLTAATGVSRVEPLEHRYAYIGADLQDLYGVNPATITGTGLQDSWFAGGTAEALMRQLAARPDGILVSAETVADYQLQPGDRISLRITGADHPATTDFHYVGVVKEFPTAPSDSFFVANTAYLDRAAGPPAAHTSLVSTDGTAPARVADQLRNRLGPSATVADITTTSATIGSSLTSVDLAGLTRVELVLALLLVATASGLLLGLTLTERRRTFTLAALLGASRRQLAGFISAEAALVATLGVAFGAAAAAAVTGVLISVLSGVFDPPPDHPTYAWSYLATAVGVTLFSLLVATQVALRASRHPDPADIRRP
ncbi:MAG TPA: FtsX-like permease family protein [Asanoa sp.]|nr:FtsX-like permease family protein [Asanoa sp.]